MDIAMVKQAADSLLNRGEITQEEYNSIDFEKIALNTGFLKGVRTGMAKNISGRSANVARQVQNIDIPTHVAESAQGMARSFTERTIPNLVESGVSSLAERVTKTMENKPLMDALKKDPKFAKEYIKIISDDIKSDAFKDAMKNPFLVRQLSDNLTKKGPLDVLGKNLKNWWMIPTTIGAAVVGKEAIVDPIVQEARSASTFQQMSKYTPQLEDADQDKIRDYFKVVKTYSPHSAANPLVAGALVNKMMEFGGVDHKLVQDMVNIQSSKPSLEAVKTLVGGGLKTLTSPSD